VPAVVAPFLFEVLAVEVAQPWPLVIAIDLARAPAVGLTVLKGTTLVAISLDIGADRSSITNRLRGAGVSVVDPPGGMGFMPPLPIPGEKMTAEEQWDGVLYGLATDIEFEYLGPQVRLVGLRRLDVGAVGADGGQRLADLGEGRGVEVRHLAVQLAVPS